MTATLISAITAALLIFIPSSNVSSFDQVLLSSIIIVFAALLFFTTAAVRIFAFAPLQKAEQNLTPKLMEIYLQDRTMRMTTLWLFCFPLISIFILLEINYFQYVRAIFTFALWLFILGISVDALNHLIKRTLQYFSPFAVVKYFTEQALVSVEKGNNLDLLEKIDGLSEIGLKSIERTLPSLCVESVDYLQILMKSTLQKASRTTTKDNFNLDQINYTLFYLFQRLEVLNEKALKSRMEPVGSAIITNLGKIAIDAAKCDFSLSIYPLQYIGKFSDLAVEENLDVIADKAACTLVEVGKSLINDTDIQYQNIKEPFLCIIKQLEEIAKSIFRKDKSTNIALLILPFQDLKELFKSPKTAAHQDSPVILSDLDRVIGQFEQLELVMRTIPPINIPEEEKE